MELITLLTYVDTCDFNHLKELLKGTDEESYRKVDLFLQEQRVDQEIRAEVARLYHMFRLVPRVLSVFRYACLFIVKTATYTGANTIQEFRELRRDNALLCRLFDRISFTVQLVFYELLLVGIDDLGITYQRCINARRGEDLIEFRRVTSDYSPQAWDEFTAYLSSHVQSSTCSIC